MYTILLLSCLPDFNISATNNVGVRVITLPGLAETLQPVHHSHEPADGGLIAHNFIAD